jgi:hypothetical protein
MSILKALSEELNESACQGFIRAIILKTSPTQKTQSQPHTTLVGRLCTFFQVEEATTENLANTMLRLLCSAETTPEEMIETLVNATLVCSLCPIQQMDTAITNVVLSALGKLCDCSETNAPLATPLQIEEVSGIFKIDREANKVISTLHKLPLKQRSKHAAAIMESLKISSRENLSGTINVSDNIYTHFSALRLVAWAKAITDIASPPPELADTLREIKRLAPDLSVLLEQHDEYSSQFKTETLMARAGLAISADLTQIMPQENAYAESQIRHDTNQKISQAYLEFMYDYRLYKEKPERKIKSQFIDRLSDISKSDMEAGIFAQKVIAYMTMLTKVSNMTVAYIDDAFVTGYPHNVGCRIPQELIDAVSSKDTTYITCIHRTQAFILKQSILSTGSPNYTCIGPFEKLEHLVAFITVEQEINIDGMVRNLRVYS